MAYVTLEDGNGHVVTVDDPLSDLDRVVDAARDQLQILQRNDPAA